MFTSEFRSSVLTEIRKQNLGRAIYLDPTVRIVLLRSFDRQVEHSIPLLAESPLSPPPMDRVAVASIKKLLEDDTDLVDQGIRRMVHDPAQELANGLAVVRRGLVELEQH